MDYREVFASFLRSLVDRAGTDPGSVASALAERGIVYSSSAVRSWLIRGVVPPPYVVPCLLDCLDASFAEREFGRATVFLIPHRRANGGALSPGGAAESGVAEANRGTDGPLAA